MRTLFKTVVLGIQYGLGMRSLAVRTGISLFEASEILARLRAQFHAFERLRATRRGSRRPDAGDRHAARLAHAVPVRHEPAHHPQFPNPITGAEILHVACVLAERRGIEVVAPVHDALVVEADADRAEEVSAGLDRVMRDAAAVVLRGYELRTDVQVIRAGDELLRQTRDRDVDHGHKIAGDAGGATGVKKHSDDDLFADERRSGGRP